MMAAFFAVPLILFFLWILGGYLPTRNIAMPAYSVVDKKDGYEIRSYDTYIVAETRQTDRDDDGSGGFMELFRYITGNNTRVEKIPMTAPVLTSGEEPGEKIPMGAPVFKLGAGTTGTIAFVMPPGSVLEKLPLPKSPLVRLKVVQPHRVAVATFSGYADAERLRTETEKLLDTLKRNGIEPVSPPFAALYNPPWTPPFMRRNEVMVEVGESSRPG